MKAVTFGCLAALIIAFGAGSGAAHAQQGAAQWPAAAAVGAADVPGTSSAEVAMRTQRAIALDEIVQKTGLAASELRRYNPALHGFQRRFRDTGTEGGVVMAVAIGYVLEVILEGRRAHILTEFRSNERVHQLLERGVTEYALRVVAFD